MIRDRYLIWLMIAAMGLLGAAQFAGLIVRHHLKAVDDELSRPNPAAVRQLSTQRARDDDQP